MAGSSNNSHSGGLNGSSHGPTHDRPSGHALAGNVVMLHQEIEGGAGAHQFRYSRSGFRYNLAVALALTALVCGLVWLITGISGSNYMNLITLAAGLIFFAFISARMLAQYWRDDVVLAIRPTGIYDGRIGTETITWDEIKELVLIRREQEFRLEIILWPSRNDGQAKTHEVNLSALEGGSQAILDAILAYKPVRLEK